MKRKLTLSLDPDVIERAKAYAEQRGKSVSQIVGDYFDALTSEGETSPQPAKGRPGRDRPLSSDVEGLIGIAEGTEEDDYRHLEEKHR